MATCAFIKENKMLSPISNEVSNFFLNRIEKNSTLYLEGIPEMGEPEKKIYFKFHDEGKDCRTVYQDGILWLAMPKYAEKNHLGAAS